jgi:pyrroline-5-carboxylate reductase
MIMLANRLLSAATAGTRLAKFSTSASKYNIFDKITFIGTGKMGQAMLSPLITQNLQSPSSMTVYDVSDAALRKVEELYPGIKASSSIPDAIADSNLIVYGVKPQNVCKVHAEIRRAKLDGAGTVRDDAIILSVVAGTPIQNYVERSLVTKVARSMPNTPAQIGCGVTVWSCTDNVDANERRRITAVLDSFGKTVFVEDESFIDMSTSISGSGPAYIFMLMEAMIDAGVHMGFSRETATTLVHHTLLGSTKFAMETGEHPGEMKFRVLVFLALSLSRAKYLSSHPRCNERRAAVLRNSVTSPAGTTASAIYELENG